MTDKDKTDIIFAIQFVLIGFGLGLGIETLLLSLFKIIK